ncbi:MAG TPA: hypothetical protein VMC06_10420, partial [Opitutaceae bacterium]|nr:hypothetical protein [Opitutaceae bacterium]
AIPFAAMLYFPAWMGTGAQRGGGIEAMGQRMIFFFGYVVVLIVALLPAAGISILPFLLVQWLAGSLPASVLAAGATASAVLVGEFAFVISWLGHRYEQFDLSVELPR